MDVSSSYGYVDPDVSYKTETLDYGAITYLAMCLSEDVTLYWTHSNMCDNYNLTTKYMTGPTFAGYDSLYFSSEC